jgi:Transposase, Mutator family
MALDESAMTELLAALRAGGDRDVVREALALVLQALIDAEATQQIGADRYQRSQQRTTHRNGTGARLLSTKAGDVELRIPKLREGSFFPALLEPRRRIDRAAPRRRPPHPWPGVRPAPGPHRQTDQRPWLRLCPRRRGRPLPAGLRGGPG